jgi:hypothetical protein
VIAGTRTVAGFRADTQRHGNSQLSARTNGAVGGAVESGAANGGLGRHAIGSNYFWYLRDPAGDFADQEAARRASERPVPRAPACRLPIP